MHVEQTHGQMNWCIQLFTKLIQVGNNTLTILQILNRPLTDILNADTYVDYVDSVIECIQRKTTAQKMSFDNMKIQALPATKYIKHA